MANVPSVFDGTFQHAGLLDFEVERVEMRFDRPIPFHVGGDAEGNRERVVMGVATRSIELLDFSGSATAA